MWCRGGVRVQLKQQCHQKYCHIAYGVCFLDLEKQMFLFFKLLLSRSFLFSCSFILLPKLSFFASARTFFGGVCVGGMSHCIVQTVLGSVAPLCFS